MIQENKKNTLKISKCKAIGKEVKISRGTGCSCVIVNKKLVKRENLINEYSCLKLLVKMCIKFKRLSLKSNRLITREKPKLCALIRNMI